MHVMSIKWFGQPPDMLTKDQADKLATFLALESFDPSPVLM